MNFTWLERSLAYSSELCQEFYGACYCHCCCSVAGVNASRRLPVSVSGHSLSRMPSFGLGPEKMNEELLERDWDDYVYGAISFRGADSTSRIFDYTVHVSRWPLELGDHSKPEY